MAPASLLHAVPTVLAAGAGQGAKQIGELALAFALSTLIGLERVACGAGLALLAIVRVGTQQLERIAGVPAVAVTMEVRGQPEIGNLATALDDLDGVLEVTTSDLAQAAD